MDKEHVLKRASKSLKNNVTEKVREQRKILRTQHLPKILEKPDVKVGFIPDVVPARIRYKEIFYFPDE